MHNVSWPLKNIQAGTIKKFGYRGRTDDHDRPINQNKIQKELTKVPCRSIYKPNANDKLVLGYMVF